MSFLTRGVADAAFRNMRIALDPAQRNPAFEIANDPPSADTWEVRLGYNGEEDPVLSFTSHKSVSRLQTREADGSLVTTDVGPGSAIDVKFDLNIRSHVSFARDQKPITDIHFTASIN